MSTLHVFGTCCHVLTGPRDSVVGHARVPPMGSVRQGRIGIPDLFRAIPLSLRHHRPNQCRLRLSELSASVIFI